MNANPSSRDTDPRASDLALGLPDRQGLSAAPFPSGLMLSAWRNAWRVPFQEPPPERDQPEPASPAHVAFAALMAIASLLLIALVP